MNTKTIQVPIYNRRFRCSVDYEDITVPVGTVSEQRQAMLAKLRDVEAKAREGMSGYEDVPGESSDDA